MTDDNAKLPALGGKHMLIVLEKKGHVGANVREHFRVYREAGARLTLCFLTGDGTEYQPDSPNDHVIGLNLTERETKRRRLKTAWRLASVVRKTQPDITIGDQYKCVASLLIGSLLAGRRPPVYALLRGFYATDSGSRRRLYKLFQSRLTGIIALTKAQKDRFVTNMPWYPANQIHIVHNYIDADALRGRMLPRDTARAELGLPDDVFVFGCIARFDPYKRITDLLQAFALIKNDLADTRLLIIGDGKEGASLRREATRLGIDDQTLFTGFLPGANRYMRAMDVFVLPSEGDNFARVFLEAAAADLPVVGVDSGGTPEVIGETASLVPARSPKALNASLKHLAQLEKKARHLQAAKFRKYCERCFTSQQLHRQLTTIF